MLFFLSFFNDHEIRITDALRRSARTAEAKAAEAEAKAAKAEAMAAAKAKAKADAEAEELARAEKLIDISPEREQSPVEGDLMSFE